ncbi:hypothetical protein PaSz4_61 [Pseudomonas phage PaSz-4]|nr:hypothetical protein PaSz4_61 [Pseudomonas phage PaSz-4]
MANMSYCRWENTLNDLRDCAEHVNDHLGGSEARARARLLELAADMLEEVGVTIDRRELDEALSNAPGGEG